MCIWCVYIWRHLGDGPATAKPRLLCPVPALWDTNTPFSCFGWLLGARDGCFDDNEQRPLCRAVGHCALSIPILDTVVLRITHHAS